MLFSFKNKYQYTYLNTYLALYFRTPKLPENTHTTDRNGVLRELKHIFPNTYQRIKSICSPAKGGTGCYRFNYQPGS